MKEDFLHHVWKFRLFDPTDLKTTQGQRLNILKLGQHNVHAGPDFENSRIIIDGIEWVGKVEIHVKSSDWDLHKHSVDPAYQNVILHVVYDHDKEIKNADDMVLPTLELKNIVFRTALDKYFQLLAHSSEFACQPFFNEISELQKINMLEKALASRLEYKAESLRHIFDACQQDFDELAYRVFAQNMGFKLNSDAFYQLAMNLPQKILRKHSNNPLQLEALLFGQAGFLLKPEDDYSKELAQEHAFLVSKYGLGNKIMDKKQWRFMRTRPANFPTIRIAQLAAVMHQNPSMFSMIIEIDDITKLKEYLIRPLNDYWQHHWILGKISNEKSRQMGASSFNILVINSVCQLLAFYSQITQQYEYFEKALKLLEQLPPETNYITRKFEKLGQKANSAFDTQAMIQQYNFSCLHKKCLNCGVAIGYLKG